MKKTLAAALAVLVLVAIRFATQSGLPTSGAQAQTAADEACQPAGRLTLRLGIGDAAPTDWSGTATGWVAGDRVSWQGESESGPLKLAGGALTPRVLPLATDVLLPSTDCDGGGNAGRTIEIETPQGGFQISPQQVAVGRPMAALGGRVEVASRTAASR